MLATIITTVIKVITEHSLIKHFSRDKTIPRYVSIRNHNFTDKKTHWHLFSSSLPLIPRPKGFRISQNQVSRKTTSIVWPCKGHGEKIILSFLSFVYRLRLEVFSLVQAWAFMCFLEV